MAMIARPVAVVFTLRDKAKATTCMFHLGGAPPSSDANVYAYIQEFYDSLKNASDCQGVGFSLTYSWIDNAPNAYGSDPNVERKGVLQFNTADGYQSLFTIPGIKSTAIAEDGIHILRAGTTFSGPIAAHLQSIHDKLQNGATSGVENYPSVDRRGQDLNGLRDAYQQHRKNPRG